MILVVLGLVGLSYYPVIIALYGPIMFNGEGSVGHTVAAIFVVVAFHILVSFHERPPLPPLKPRFQPTLTHTRAGPDGGVVSPILRCFVSLFLAPKHRPA